MYKPVSILAVSALSSFLFAGCSSIPDAYYPQSTGPSLPTTAESGIKVHISTDSETAVKGEPIQFSVAIENVSSQDLIIPRRPHVVFAWTYANGVRDNFVMETPSEWFFHARDVVKLKPGATLDLTIPVKTYYFERLGITEFHAIVRSPRNTNAALGSVWQGYVTSNRFGVRVTDRRDYAWVR